MNLKRFEELFERHLDGALRPEEREELTSMMEDPRARRRFVELSVMGRAIAEEIGVDWVVPRTASERAMVAAPGRDGGAAAASHGRRQNRRSAGRGSRRWFTYGLAVIGAAAALLLAVSWWGPLSVVPAEESLRAKVAGVEGRVLRSDDGSHVPVRPGDWVSPGQRLETGARGRVELGYPGEATRLRLGSKTTLRLESSGKSGNRAKRYRLEQGEFSADVAPQPAGSPMVVVTPHARVEVVGTRFRLVASAVSTRLEVLEGLVRMSEPGSAAVEVAAGMSATAGRSRRLVVSRIVDAVSQDAVVDRRRSAVMARVVSTVKLPLQCDSGDACTASHDPGERLRFYCSSGFGLGSFDLKTGIAVSRQPKGFVVKDLAWYDGKLWCLGTRLRRKVRESVLCELDPGTLQFKKGIEIAVPEALRSADGGGVPAWLVSTGRGLHLFGSQEAYRLVPDERRWERLTREDRPSVVHSRPGRPSCCWGGRSWAVEPSFVSGVSGGKDLRWCMIGRPLWSISPGKRAGAIEVRLPPGSVQQRVSAITPAGKGCFLVAVDRRLIFLDTGIGALAGESSGGGRTDKGRKPGEPGSK